MKKIVSAFICALLVCTLLFTGLFCIGEVQAASKPSVPQFTVKFVDSSHDVESYTSTTIDEFTGKETIITHPSHHVDQRTIEVTIKNQPFTPYIDASGEKCGLYYRVEFKGHFSDNWRPFVDSHIVGYYYQSDSAYTVLTYTAFSSVSQFEAGAKLDFRVRAAIAFTGDNLWSDWSKVQTLTIPAYNNEAPNQNEPTPSPTYTPDQPPQTDQSSQPELTIAGFSLVEFGLVLACAVVVVLSIALIYTRKTVRHKQTTQT